MMWRDLFNLQGGAASIQEINQRILADATVSGTNLIVLVMAIVIACVGLNMNSVAVIIGAMLISPLMGGIVAVGYGMATYDVHFIRQSMIKLAFQVGFAILTASIYFAISPLAYSTDELLARTTPTIWDVIVALCGGIAGAVGNTRREKSNVIPGVAIATALMPPLCTAGYGLASGQSPFFLGAMYLFFINAFFIALAAFFVFKVLDVPSHGDITASQFQQRLILAALGILITAPSIYLAYQMVEENLRDMQVKNFISEDMDFQTTSVVSYTVKNRVLTVDLVGTLLTEEEIAALQDELHARNRLQDLELVVIQGQRELDREQIQKLITARLEKQSVSEKEVSYKNLSAQYYPAYKRAAADQQIIEILTQQGPLLFPEVLSIQGGTLTAVTHQKKQPQAEEKKVDHKRFMVEVIVKEPLQPEEAERLQKWIVSQVEMPVLMTVQTADHPSDFYGDGIAWP